MNRQEFKNPGFIRIGSPKLASAAWVICEGQQVTRKRNTSVYSVLILSIAIIAILFFAGGCSTKVKGGELRHETGSLDLKGGQQTASQIVRSIDIRPDGSARIELNASSAATTQPSLKTDHDNLATTQPSAETNTGQMPKIGSADEGEIGGIGFTQAAKSFKNAWWLGLIFLLGGGVFLYRGIRSIPISIGQIAFGILLLACGVATILAPLAFLIGIVIMAVGGVGYFWYSERKNLNLTVEAKDIVDNVEKGIAALPLEMRSKFKAETARDMDKTSKRRVSILKNA